MILIKGWKDAALPVHERRLHEQRHTPGQHLVHQHQHCHHDHHQHHHHIHHYSLVTCSLFGVSSANFYQEFMYNVKAAVILLALNLHLGVLLFLFPNSLIINQVESNLSRLNFWSLAHLLLMLIVGVSQVV